MISQVLILLLFINCMHSFVLVSQPRCLTSSTAQTLPTCIRHLQSRSSTAVHFNIDRDENDIESPIVVSDGYFMSSLLPFFVLGGFLVASAVTMQQSTGMNFLLPTAVAETIGGATTNLFDPSNFQPVCPASDSFYQVAKSIANALVGSENVVEYGPLIASVLLRVRLELCVFESFLYEAVLPFVKEKGLSWILPLHETLETLIAGIIFAVSSNFILLGSTKIFTVILIYLDALFGWPNRIIGGLLQRFFSGKTNAAPSVIGQVMKITGDVIGTVRRTVEGIDTFVGRYLVFGTTVYVIFKFLHYKLFNNIFP